MQESFVFYLRKIKKKSSPASPIPSYIQLEDEGS